MRVDIDTQRIMEDMRHELNIAMVDAAHQIVEAAQSSVPTRTRKLSRSARVVERGANNVVIIYDTAYAGRVYWDKSLKHRRGKAQWIRAILKGKGKKIIRQCLIKQLGG